MFRGVSGPRSVSDFRKSELKNVLSGPLTDTFAKTQGLLRQERTEGPRSRPGGRWRVSCKGRATRLRHGSRLWRDVSVPPPGPAQLTKPSSTPRVSPPPRKQNPRAIKIARSAAGPDDTGRHWTANHPQLRAPVRATSRPARIPPTGTGEQTDTTGTSSVSRSSQKELQSISGALTAQCPTVPVPSAITMVTHPLHWLSSATPAPRLTLCPPPSSSATPLPYNAV
ncbi:hypothetical protein AAFF_G00064010 [Aldrovandia affinis]|uniref:Uncharacterized protein n=1 Tax=Aldrovandia affinis TaxID=143900 RepID=A0AAD7WYM7_9TELE|nr:hypothetical protein AAFF_G00064010 [Aldrovandia affinis]